MNQLIERQFEFKSRIAIVGDSILDEYYEVDSNRVSPEFPIPVLFSENPKPSKIALGGASNVCAQISNFNFDIELFSFINKEIKSLASQHSITTDSCLILEDDIPIKKRYYNSGFPLCRLDIESINYRLDDKKLAELQSSLLEKLYSSEFFDVVIFSDYNKGLFAGQQNLISKLNSNSITIVDPKCTPIERWKGCTIIKPNSKEAENISGYSDPQKQCEYFFEKTNCQAVIITQAANGIFGSIMGDFFEYRPNIKKNPRSVVGAGDCFIAFLSMCMAHSIDIKESVKMAFDAASVYVQNIYNSPLYAYQIDKDKFIHPKSLIKRNFKLGFTNGCFDILHPGHIELLKFAKSKCDKLVVALNSDESVAKQNKSHSLVNSLEYRKLMISSLEFVDFVLDFSGDTPMDLIKLIKPEVLIKGSDWPSPIGSDIVSEFYSFDIFGDYSTTKIIEKIKNM